MATVPHEDVIKWKYFPRNWPFVRGIHRSPVNSPHKGQWSGALMISLIYGWRNGWVNNREAGDSRRHRTHYNVTVMRKRKNQPYHHLELWMLSNRQPLFSVVMDIHYNDLSLYRQISNMRRTYSQNIKVSRLVLQLSLRNLLKHGVKWNMKM